MLNLIPGDFMSDSNLAVLPVVLAKHAFHRHVDLASIYTTVYLRSCEGLNSRFNSPNRAETDQCKDSGTACEF